MHEITVQIKLVIFGIVADSLVVYAPNGHLPSEKIVKETALDKQVEKMFLKNLEFQIRDNYVEQLYTISNEKNEITIVYYILLPLEKDQLKHNQKWLHFKDIQKNNFDYDVVAYAVQRLRWKVEYTNVVYSLLPEEFTLSELQNAYEAVLGHVLDKRNFRKKIESLAFLQSTGKKRISVSRPAQTYSFKKRSPIMIRIFS